jgi:molybdopterin converting factor small subunit
MSKDELPSIEDFNGGDSLPSIKDFIIEEKVEKLPSVENIIENNNLPSIEEIKEENDLPSVDDYIEEETATIEDAQGNTFAEVEDIIPPWPELLKIINDVREEIPDIPEIKYYDAELEKLCEIVDEVRSEIPEVKYYDAEVEAICEQIDLVRNTISELPEVKYYDEQINSIEDKINLIKEDIINLPEPKYYDNDLQSIREDIEIVKKNFPWIEANFKGVEESLQNVNDSIGTVGEKIGLELDSILETVDVKVFENKVIINEVKDNFVKDKQQILADIKESSQKIFDLHNEFKDDDRKLKKQIQGEYNKLKQSVQEQLEKYNQESVKTDELLLKYFTDLKEEISKTPEVKYYDDDIDTLQESVKKSNKRFLPIESDIKSLYKIVEDIKKTQIKLNEQILDEPADVNQDIGGGKDPLTPTDQKFATLDDLSKHYSLFVNRIQQQLSTIGGGGAGFIKDLDDVTFDQTTGTNKLLIYDGAKWVGIASTAIGGGGGGGGATTLDEVLSEGNTSTTGMSVGVITATNIIASTATFSGNVSVGGTLTYEDVTNVDSLGLGTFRSGLEVNTGTAQTALIVRGDARITGVLTVGEASVTIDGDNNIVTVGIVTISNSDVIIGENVTINAGATGINSAPNVLYVAKDGNDDNNGTSIDNAKLTISAAVGIATTGTVIKVLAGNYAENNPIEVPAFVSVVGDDLKTVTVTPNTANDDLFHVRKGCYLANMTFTNHVAPAAAVGFPTSEVATNVGGGKWESPYIQNCTSNTTTGTGLRIDGDQAESLKSIVVDSYTQYNQGGVGVAITNSGFAQLVSVFTICCNEAITCHKGSTCDLTNSNSSFGTFGLVSDGVSEQQFTGVVTATAAAAQDTVTIGITTTTRPYNGQVVYFGELFESVQTISVGSGGTGYTSTPTVTVDAPTGPSGETATAFATLEGESVTSITIISSGSQYQSTPNITISAPDVGINTATATANMSPIYYTINSSTPIVSGISTLTLDENLINSVGVGTTVYFFQQSKIVASSHTFEYVGSGNDITSATPLRGGVPVQANEVVTSNGGNVVYTSTDQSGNFRIGDDFEINQNTGTISGRAFSRSLFSEMTPFILALS